MKMSDETFKKYAENPLGMDALVRKECQIPDNRYYSVSVYPPHLAGNVWIVKSCFREVTAKKISKSDAK